MMKTRIPLILILFATGQLSAQNILLGPPPELAPPKDNLGELFPVDGAQSSESSAPDLTPFPERTPSSLGEWESLEPAEPEIPDGLILYQGPVTQPPPIDKHHPIETHDGFQDYGNSNSSTPGWVLPAIAVGVLLLSLATGFAIWRQRRMGPLSRP